MTRAHNTPVECPRCGHGHTAESAFQRWMRNNPHMDSKDGHVRSDLDFIIHRYKSPDGSRHIQCMMFVEVKTHGAKVSESQGKTLSILRQLLQNQGDRSTYCSDGRGGPFRMIRSFGGFELRMSGACPETSVWIEWNRKRISIQTLNEILTFDKNPITLKKMDWRYNHHHPDKTLDLFPQPAAA